MKILQVPHNTFKKKQKPRSDIIELRTNYSERDGSPDASPRHIGHVRFVYKTQKQASSIKNSLKYVFNKHINTPIAFHPK